MVWDPEHYKCGNYFQNEVSNAFRASFNVEPYGTILDVGCGDGQYSRLLADTLKPGRILAIDSSQDMVRHANHHWASENLSFEVHCIEEFQPVIEFDVVLSFWCLHWTNIHASFPNIFRALKPGGRVYAVFSSFSDNSILQTWAELVKQDRYRELTERYTHTRGQRENYFFQVVNRLNQLPFKHVKLNLHTTRTYLPSIDYFKNLLLTMPFMKTFSIEIIDSLIEDMLAIFQARCETHYGGKLYYETRPIFLEAIK